MDYRFSHTSEGYANVYSKTYKEGYFYTQWNELEKNILKEIFSNLKKENTKFLDFACGTGRVLKFSEDFFHNTFGVDISEEMLSHARNECKKSSITCQDITISPMEDKFDIITSFRFFLHAQDNLREDVLKSLFSSLNEDGLLVINIHVNSKSILGIFYRLRNFIFQKEVAKVASIKEISVLLEKNGFKITDVKYYSFLPRIGWKFSNFYKKYLKRFDFFVKSLSFLPKTWAQSYIICAKKDINKINTLIK